MKTVNDLIPQVFLNTIKSKLSMSAMAVGDYQVSFFNENEECIAKLLDNGTLLQVTHFKNGAIELQQEISGENPFSTWFYSLTTK